MRGLQKIPPERQISKAYFNLQSAEQDLSEIQISLYSQWSRLDPRLAEILIKHLSLYWKKYHPIKLNAAIRSQIWPAVLGVLLNHVPFYHQQKKTHWTEENLFKKWSDCVMDSVIPAKNEIFLIDIYKPGSKFLYKEAFHSTKIYKQYGYLGTELLINKAQPAQKTLIPLNQRKIILNELVKKSTTLTVQEYLSELNFQIHRKQPQRALNNHPKLRADATTKKKTRIRVEPKSYTILNLISKAFV